jgi:hypothetical protein
MRKTLGYAALIAAIGAGGAGAVEAPVAAASQTVVYTFGMACHWQGPAVRPGEIGFGAHYDVANLHWSTWRPLSATGRGHYYGFGSYNANVKLYRVKVHNGQKYFAWISITSRGHPNRYLQYSGGCWYTR